MISNPVFQYQMKFGIGELVLLSCTFIERVKTALYSMNSNKRIFTKGGIL
jgi:hypothetical protein